MARLRISKTRNIRGRRSSIRGRRRQDANDFSVVKIMGMVGVVMMMVVVMMMMMVVVVVWVDSAVDPSTLTRKALVIPTSRRSR